MLRNQKNIEGQALLRLLPMVSKWECSPVAGTNAAAKKWDFGTPIGSSDKTVHQLCKGRKGRADVLLHRMVPFVAPSSQSHTFAACPLLGSEADSICSVRDFQSLAHSRIQCVAAKRGYGQLEASTSTAMGLLLSLTRTTNVLASLSLALRP
jgi:hypothetical protein